MTPSAVQYLIEWCTSVDVTKDIQKKFVQIYQDMSSSLLADGIERVFTVDDIKDIIDMSLKQEDISEDDFKVDGPSGDEHLQEPEYNTK